MSIETWFAFIVASAVLLAIPGPTVMLVVGFALDGGRRTAPAAVPGVALGDLTAMTASLLGAGAVIAASATLFTVLKLAGAAYLVWMGVRLWRAPAVLGPASGASVPRSGHAMFLQAYSVTALNPKGIVFFIAFVPQFLDPTGSLAAQAAILVATFVVMAAVNALAWALFAAELRRRFASPGLLRWLNRAGGTLLIGAGALTALARRA